MSDSTNVQQAKSRAVLIDELRTSVNAILSAFITTHTVNSNTTLEK